MEMLMHIIEMAAAHSDSESGPQDENTSMAQKTCV